MNEVELQRRYYAQTAENYDVMHLAHDWEHILALHLLASYIEFYQMLTSSKPKARDTPSAKGMD